MLRLTLLCLLALATLAAPAQAARDQIVTFEAPELRDPAKRDATIVDLERLGVQALRITMFWRDVAPREEGGSYDWGAYDPVVQVAEDRGWDVVLTLSGPIPRWASESGRSSLTRPRPEKFQEFARLAAERYGSRAERFAIWNEPNHPDFLRPQYVDGRPASGRIYRRLVSAGLRGLAAAGVGSDRVLIGETAPVGTGKVVAPLTFLRQTLCLDSRYRQARGCGRFDVGGWAHHPYTRAEGPFTRPASRNAVTIGVLSRLTTALDRAARAGALPARLPVWITEFGVQSEPDPLAGVSFLRQNEYRAIAERLAFDNPRVRSFSQYLLFDDAPVPGAPRIARYPGFESGLRTHDGRAKPAFDGFRLPLAAYRLRSGVSLWGVVRPARGATEVRITFSDGNGYRPLQTVRTDARGAWRLSKQRFRRGRRYRAEWTTPAGTVVRGAPARAYRRR
jgi:hypothetical protein